MPGTQAAIDVEGLSISFPLYHGNARSLKKTVFSTVTGRMASLVWIRPTAR